MSQKVDEQINKITDRLEAYSFTQKELNIFLRIWSGLAERLQMTWRNRAFFIDCNDSFFILARSWKIS